MIFTSINPPYGYYVYAYLRTFDHSPYYIGKGKDTRAWKKARGEIGKPKHDTCSVILEHNLTEIGALAIERRMIAWYGRIDLGTGILRNKTDDGDGGNGIKLTSTQRAKISQMKKGKKMKTRSPEHCARLSASKSGKNNPNYGKSLTSEQRSRLSTALKGKPQTKSGLTRTGLKRGPYKKHNTASSKSAP